MTWQTIIDRATKRANMLNSKFVGASSWLQFAVVAQLECCRLIASAYGDHWFSFVDVTVGVSGQTMPFTLDNGTKVLGITKDPGTPLRMTIHRHPTGERDARSPVITYGMATTAGGQPTIQLEPIESCAGNYRIYVQQFPAEPSGPAVVVDPVVEQFQEYVETGMAIRALNKAERPVARLLRRQNQLKAQVIQMASTRDVAEPGRVADVDDRPSRRLWRR